MVLLEEKIVNTRTSIFCNTYTGRVNISMTTEPNVIFTPECTSLILTQIIDFSYSVLKKKNPLCPACCERIILKLYL